MERQPPSDADAWAMLRKLVAALYMDDKPRRDAILEAEELLRRHAADLPVRRDA